MPEQERASFVNHLMQSNGGDSQLVCYESSLPYCICDNEAYDNRFPDLNFTIGGVSYFVPKERYVFKQQYGWSQICTLGLMSSPFIDLWILGLNFFPNYYTIFDQEDLKVGFVLTKNADEVVKSYHQN